VSSCLRHTRSIYANPQSRSNPIAKSPIRPRSESSKCPSEITKPRKRAYLGKNRLLYHQHLKGNLQIYATTLSLAARIPQQSKRMIYQDSVSGTIVAKSSSRGADCKLIRTRYLLNAALHSDAFNSWMINATLCHLGLRRLSTRCYWVL
jgi:hypothetical protein